LIPKVFGRPLIASRLRNRILTSRAIDQRNLRQQIIFIQIELFDVDFGSISPYKGVGVDLLFTHIIFFKIALIYILIIVGIPAATAIAIALHLAVARAMIGRQTQIRLTPAFGRRIEQHRSLGEIAMFQIRQAEVLFRITMIQHVSEDGLVARFPAPGLNGMVDLLNRPHPLRENWLLLAIRDRQVVHHTEPVPRGDRLHFVVTIGVKGHKARRKEAAVGKRVALALTGVANDQLAAFMRGGQIHH